jgi:hypothetical protein
MFTDNPDSQKSQDNGHLIPMGAVYWKRLLDEGVMSPRIVSLSWATAKRGSTCRGTFGGLAVSGAVGFVLFFKVCTYHRTTGRY